MKCSLLTSVCPSVCRASHMLSLIATLTLSQPDQVNNINIILYCQLGAGLVTDIDINVGGGVPATISEDGEIRETTLSMTLSAMSGVDCSRVMESQNLSLSLSQLCHIAPHSQHY